MTSQKINNGIFQADVVDQHEYKGVLYTIYSNRIFHVCIPKLQKVQMDIIDEGYKFLDKNGGGKFYNIYEFDSFSDIEPELREWAADSDGNSYTYTDAIVIGSLSQKIITDFYLRVNKPIRRTKIFYSLEKSIKWTLDQIK